jgi:hypothetical protein
VTPPLDLHSSFSCRTAQTSTAEGIAVPASDESIDLHNENVRGDYEGIAVRGDCEPFLASMRIDGLVLQRGLVGKPKSRSLQTRKNRLPSVKGFLQGLSRRMGKATIIEMRPGARSIMFSL